MSKHNHDKIQVIGKNIFFQFEDKVQNGKFIDKTESGIYLGFNSDASAKGARRGVVTHIGPNVYDVQVGDTILIEALGWSDGMKVNGEQFWMTHEEKIIGIVD